MASLPTCRRALLSRNFTRTISTATTTSSASPLSSSTTPDTTSPSPSSTPELTHYKITLRRSGISLGFQVTGTLEALGIHRRNQTVFHRHSSDIAGKILRVKELVEVRNVPASEVRNKWEQRQDRKAVRGYKVVGSKRDTFMRV